MTTIKREDGITGGKLILTVVRRSLGERVVALTRAAGAKGGTVVPGRAKSDGRLERFLEIDDAPEDVILTLASDEDSRSIMEALGTHEERTVRHRQGFAVQLDVRRILKNGAMSRADGALRRIPEMENASGVLICVIVNRGCADDIIFAAREAGSGPGVILNGRGTASEKDVEFLGIPLFPEKEIVLILARPEQADPLLRTLGQNPCLTRPGGGIAFAVDAEKIISLGKIPG
ncbi:MAG: hypothetical protein GX181_10405 [Synergistaceae bacterium]|nr:hypothetical protein [Synergistota bacterium]NLM72351.1 hypothetical protein [Synergistaceae bacterium]